MTPVLLFHPFVIGTVEAAYWAGWRFNPGKNAQVFNATAENPMKDFDPPLTAPQRHSYEVLLSTLKKSEKLDEDPGWRHLQSVAKPELDSNGRPLLRVPMEGSEIPVGVCRGNALHVSASAELLQSLLVTRLDAELRTKNAVVSEQLVKSDWKLLQSARDASQAGLKSLAADRD